MNNPLQTQIQNDLARSRSGLLREAQALRFQMDNLISRLEAGGSAIPMDSLGSRPTQFESALSETTTLQNVLFHLTIESNETQIDRGGSAQAPEYDETEDVAAFLTDAEPLLSNPGRMTQSQRFQQFESDMEMDGFEVEHYRGRNFYAGPAVRVSDDEGLQRVMSATTIPVQTDQMGHGTVVYPR